MENNWKSLADELPDKEVNKEVIFAVPRQKIINEEKIVFTSGAIFYTWQTVPSVDWVQSVGGKWIEVPELKF